MAGSAKDQAAGCPRGPQVTPALMSLARLERRGAAVADLGTLQSETHFYRRRTRVGSWERFVSLRPDVVEEGLGQCRDPESP